MGPVMNTYPASRCQLEDYSRARHVLDPAAFDWQDEGWRWNAHPWEETGLLRLQVGSGELCRGVRPRLCFWARTAIAGRRCKYYLHSL